MGIVQLERPCDKRLRSSSLARRCNYKARAACIISVRKNPPKAGEKKCLTFINRRVLRTS